MKREERRNKKEENMEEGRIKEGGKRGKEKEWVRNKE
jgi:hypothetical protein